MSRLFEASLARVTHKRDLVHRARYDEEHLEWAPRLASSAKLAFEQLEPPRSPFEAVPITGAHPLPPVRLTTVGRFPSLPGSRLRRRREKQTRARFTVSETDRREAREIASIPRPDMKAPENALDGVPHFAPPPDWSALRRQAPPYSSITVFFDRVGHF
jgi:hypothetical protein